MIQKFKSYILDLDGTLVDTAEDIITATNQTVAHFGADPFPHDVILDKVSKGVRDLIMNQIQVDPYDQERRQKILDYFAKCYLEICTEHAQLFPGALDLFEQCQKENILLAIHTNKPAPFTDKILSGLNIKNYFVTVMAAESGFPSKPDPLATLEVLKRLGTAAKETLMVGDSIVDLQTGENVGMPVALHLNGYTKRSEIESLKNRALKLYENLTDLME